MSLIQDVARVTVQKRSYPGGYNVPKRIYKNSERSLNDVIKEGLDIQSYAEKRPNGVHYTAFKYAPLTEAEKKAIYATPFTVVPKIPTA